MSHGTARASGAQSGPSPAGGGEDRWQKQREMVGGKGGEESLSQGRLVVSHEGAVDRRRERGRWQAAPAALVRAHHSSQRGQALVDLLGLCELLAGGAALADALAACTQVGKGQSRYNAKNAMSYQP